MRKEITIAIIFFIAAPCVNSSPRSKVEWIARHAVIAAALTTDTKTTCDGLRRGLQEYMFGNSCNAAIGINIGAFAWFSFLDYEEEKVTKDSTNKAKRIFGRWSTPAILGGMYGYSSYHNASLQ